MSDRNNKKSGCDDWVEQPDYSNLYSIYERTISRCYDIYLTGHISNDSSKYRDFINILRRATVNDSVNIHISSPGGSMNVGIELINAIKSCAGVVTTALTAPSASMASILLLTGDYIDVSDNTYIMFHDFSLSYGDEMIKSSDISKGMEADRQHYHELLKKYCSPFLTDDEIKDISNGQDLYIHDKEIVERLCKVNEIINAANQKDEKPIRKTRKRKTKS